jgi:hypothetical protein
VADDLGFAHSQPAQRLGDQVCLIGNGVAGIRFFGASVTQEIDRDHPMGGGEQGHHPVPPVDRAGEAVDEHDRAGVGRALVDHLKVSTGEVEDLPAGHGHFGRLGLLVGDHGVEPEQHHDAQHHPDEDLPASAHAGRYPSPS